MRIKYIDVLKAFAIISVVLYHTGVMTYGYLGVDLFLVIAGYLTTKSLYAKTMVADNPGGGGRLYVNFELSRIVRLLPPLLVAGLFCMVLGYFTMLPDEYENVGETVIATNCFANNILASITTKNYWDVSNEYAPLMHTWYVGVVMQFYLVYPVLFLLAKLDKKDSKSTLLTMISALAVISLLVYFATTDTAHRFYYLPSRFFEFAVGGIVALLYNPKENKPFKKGFVYVCYVLLLALMFINADLIPAIIRLVAVVSLSCVVLCSQDCLENQITGKALLARIGAASYSIFIWHQILLAFYRYTITSKFGLGSFAILLAGTAILSWLSYCFIEQKTTQALKTKHGTVVLYSLIAIVFVILNAFAGWIYLRAGVVRDIPELYISVNDVHRGMHAEYVDRVYKYDKPFKTDKKHWYVIGNSFARDFVNVILESPIADQVEVSYTTEGSFKNEGERFAQADHVFFSTLGLTDKLISEVEIMCLSNGLSREQFTIVGEKNFGESNGQIYARRNKSDYFDQYIEVADKERYINRNHDFANKYGNCYLDLMSMVTNENNEVRVFTPDHHFMSADCGHLSKGGAIYYGQLIDWLKYLK
jgi:peptidoglycan/LPS O-acetylase OafA/YrhL